jgi:hypothetical protein
MVATSGSGAADGSGGVPNELAPTWRSELGAHGIEKASISFREGGAVVVHIWEVGWIGDTAHTFEETGELRSTKELVIPDAFAVDPGGRFHAVSTEGGCSLLVDGTHTASLGVSCHGAGYGFAGDGSFVSQVSCYGDEGTTYIRVFDVSDDALESETATDLPCTDARPLVLTDASRGRTLFTNQERPQIFVFDWAAARVRALSVHDESESSKATHVGTVVNMSLSHDGMRLITVGTNDGLAWLEPETYEVGGHLPDVPYFNLFDDCSSCKALSVSVLAWSADDEFYATTNAAGGIDIRETETHAVVTRLTPPIPSEDRIGWSSDYGPVQVSFSPEGESLVALYPDVVVAYDWELP